jgi:hypothetical protein
MSKLEESLCLSVHVPQKFLQIYSRPGALDHTMILRVEGQDITLQGRPIGSTQSFDREGSVPMQTCARLSHMTP